MKTSNHKLISGPSMRKNFFYFLIKLSVTILILYFVLSYVPFHEYRHALTLFSAQLIISVLLLVIVQVCFLALRWYLLARSAGSTLAIHSAFFGILMSFFFSQGLPSSIGGDAFRIWWHKQEGISTSSALKIIFFDRIYGLLALILLCICSSFLLTYFLNHSAKIISLLMLISFLSIILGLLIMPWRFGLSERLVQFSIHMPSRISKIFKWILETRTLLSQQRLSTTLCVLSIGLMTHFIVVIQVYLIGHILNPEKVNFLICLSAVPPAMLISYMPFSIAGWGVREASMVISFGLFGISAATALMTSLTLGMTILIISLLGGMLWITGVFRKTYVNKG